MISLYRRRQFELLLKVLPYIFRLEEFALKGGTAINLFHNNLPRLSVDIDLTYLPMQQSRATALRGISDALDNLKQLLEEGIEGIHVRKSHTSNGYAAKLFCRHNGTQIKIEVNPVMRGCLWEPVKLQVCQKAQDEFGLFALAQVVSRNELYGGKICAALERQHPRDLFDIHILMNERGIDEELKLGFIATLLGSRKPMHETLSPNLVDISSEFDSQFAGLSDQRFNYDCFDNTRRELIETVHNLLSPQDKAFLVSVMSGNPDWTLFPVAGVEQMAAVQWKLLNIRKLKEKNIEKLNEQLLKLKQCLGIEHQQ